MNGHSSSPFSHQSHYFLFTPNFIISCNVYYSEDMKDKYIRVSNHHIGHLRVTRCYVSSIPPKAEKNEYINHEK